MSITATQDPFGALGRIIGRGQEPGSKGYFSFCPTDTWTPNVNLYETEAAYLVCVDLAGVDKDKIDLTLIDGRLKLKGHRNVPSNVEGEESNLHGKRIRLHLMEIDHGSFNREVELPEDVDADKIGATYRNGMLWVEIPKK